MAIFPVGMNTPDGLPRPPLHGKDEISLPGNAVLIFEHPAAPTLYIHSGATAIRWLYHLNTSAMPTLGGEVVQILSAAVGPITITGQTAGLKTSKSGKLDHTKETRGWIGEAAHTDYRPDRFGLSATYAPARTPWTPQRELEAIMAWFRDYMTAAGTDTVTPYRDQQAIKFTYPERGWSFYIQVTKLEGFRYDRAVVAPEWSITAEVVSDNALDYFAGITMSSFTDDLVANQTVIGQVGLSAFARGGTERNNAAFGQDGSFTSSDPFLNPALQPNAGELARTMGDNFQQLLAAWNTGDFATFGFGSALNNGALPQNVDAAYASIFGANFLGRLPGTGGASTSSEIASGIAQLASTGSVQTTDEVVAAIVTAFEAVGIPGRLGVAVAINESGLNPNRTQDGCNMPQCGIGLFQVNGDGSGRDSSSMVKEAGAHRVYESKQGNITPYYPASAQIAAAASWFNRYAHSNFPGVNFMTATNEQLGTLAAVAQGAPNPTGYASLIAGLLGRAQQAIDTAGSRVNNTTVVPSGSSQNLARQLLSYAGTKWRDDNGQGRAQIQKVANGEALNSPGGGLVNLNPKTMQVVLALIGRGYSVGTYAWCEDHSNDGAGGHAGGNAVDISSINGVAINQNSQQAHDLTLLVASILHNFSSPLTPRQLICAGYGNHYSSDIIRLCITDPVGTDPMSYYGSATLSQHTNHIHVGF